MFSYAQALIGIIAIVRKLVELGERNSWIEEGERNFILKESLAVSKVLKFKDKVKAEKLTKDQLFKELEDDFRD